MSKHSAPFTIVAMTTLLLVTIVIVIIALSSQLPKNKLIKASVVGLEAPTCGSATSEFGLGSDLGITGEGVAGAKNQAIKQAKQSLSSRQQDIETTADPELFCGRGCYGNETTCKWSKVACSADEISNGAWKATCDGAVTCSKTCSK